MNYFDLHCDTISECTNHQVSVFSNNLQLSIERGLQIEDWVQVYAIWMDDALEDEAAYTYFNRVYDYFLKQMEEWQEVITFCKSSKEIRQTLKSGKRAACLSIEGSRALGGKIDRVEEFYNKGVRMMTLTWNGRTHVADGCMVEQSKGLTDFGREVIKKMNDIGMIIDVSHLAEQGFWEIVHMSEKPFIATHSNSKVICNHPRNLTDEQFKIIVERNGLVGMNFYPLFINGTYEADIEELIAHIDHFLQLGGEDIIAMGSDFDGAKMPTHMEGVQDIDYLYKLLIKRYGQEKADKFYFKNALRFFEKNL